MQDRHGIAPRPAPALLAAMALALALGGCASPSPAGYGLPSQAGTAAQAHQEMDKAERSTQLDAAQTYLDLIAQMQQAGQWYASLAHTQAFEQQYGVQPHSQLMRADALRNTGQLQQALQAYGALLQGATAARARRGMGLLHASQGQYPQAVEQLEMARQLNPIDASVLSDLAYAHMLDGALAAARVPMMQAAQLAPGNARVQLNLALYWLASGHQDEATQLLQRLSQPASKGAAPLIDQQSLQTLKSQLASVQRAVGARTGSAEEARARPPQPSVQGASVAADPHL